MGVVGEEDGEVVGGEGEDLSGVVGVDRAEEGDVGVVVVGGFDGEVFEGGDAEGFGAGEDELDVGVGAVGFPAAGGDGLEGVFLDEGEDIVAEDVVAAEGEGKEVGGLAEAEGGCEEGGEGGVSGGVGEGGREHGG